ncbi:hypothetical protein BDU57DRAFT_332080 [Ampelomyces quisqualis]|uniref:Uncharacterized protein n=1 Tax=Ampelomyces quisqualis TaxID=50730 RepID=A0A6A5QF21_AMPQU|nr:hypothetical protein BDU57DRAFT_332080 [Ampelomyces quisqualis]
MKGFMASIALVTCILCVAAHPQGASRSRSNTIRSSGISVTKFDTGCGLATPNAQEWTANLPAIKIFTEKNYEEFKKDRTQSSFANYLRDKHAPNAAPSAMFCDIVGDCSIGSCLNLNQDSPKHEQQIAYLVFEQIAGVAHHLQAFEKATSVAGDWIIRQTHPLVKRFSSAEHVEQTLKSQATKEKVAIAIGTAFAILGAGAVSAATIGMLPAAALVPKLSYDLLAAGYFGVTGTVNALRQDVPDFSGNLEKLLTETLDKILNDWENNVNKDLRALMTGAPNHKNMTIIDVLTSGDFLGPDPDLQTFLQEQEERYLFAAAVNSAWQFDRPYILDVDAPEGGCEADDRGHSNYRVCLPEYPNKSFWLYAIGITQENDFMKDDQAQVHGPSGFHEFDSMQTATHNITREDIVRSSLFVHHNKLEDALMDLEVPNLQAALERDGLKPTNNDENSLKFLGSIPGVFSVPVCRNPSGESISSVLDDRGRNYPCMCGEFTWNEGWTIEKDETLKFLKLTGFAASEDWEAFCSHKNKCEGENSIDWHKQLDHERKKGDPGIPKKLKHPFKKCNRVNSHDHKGKPEKDK